MATPNPTTQLRGLARRLVVDNLLVDEQSVDAYEKALKSKTPFVSYLVDKINGVSPLITIQPPFSERSF